MTPEELSNRAEKLRSDAIALVRQFESDTNIGVSIMVSRVSNETHGLLYYNAQTEFLDPFNRNETKESIKL